MVSTAVVSNKGTRKTVNQDACCLSVARTPRGEAVMSVVCDGVGGLAHGEVASSTVVRSFASWFRNELPKAASGGSLALDQIARTWERMLGESHSRLVDYGMRQGMAVGTTFTGVYACEGRYLVAQVGDCRLYLVRDGDARQMTRDQTFVARLVERGELTAQEAACHPFRSMITQAVGVGQEPCPVFGEGTYEPRDLFVLCSDGVYRSLDEGGLRNAFLPSAPWCDESLRAACRHIVRRAMRQGEPDNLTVTCFCLDEDEPPRLCLSGMGGA